MHINSPPIINIITLCAAATKAAVQKIQNNLFLQAVFFGGVRGGFSFFEKKSLPAVFLLSVPLA